MLIHWVWYAELAGISLAQKLHLLEQFRDPEDLYHADPDKLTDVPAPITQALEDKDLRHANAIIEECAVKGIGILPLTAKSYPSRLRNTYDPPLVLYFKGVIPDWESVPVIGIVGTRKATPYGMNTAKRFGSQIAACGALVVSGGAAGIDTKSMEGALDIGKPTVAVLGCGVDVVYPASNKELFSKVTEQGCLLSEYPPKTKPAHWHFPERNRIISGMANALLVVEAPEKSGALITASRAMEQGRDVFAVPGNIDVDACKGSNALLQDVAAPALTGWDVVKDYQFMYPGKVCRKDPVIPASETVLQVSQTPVIPANTEKEPVKNDKKVIDKEEKSTYSVGCGKMPDLTEAERILLEKIRPEGILIDALIAQADMPAGAVRTMLTKLALKGLVKNHPGGRVSRK